MHDLFFKHDICFRKSCPDTQQQNKRKHKHLLEITHSFLFDASLQASFWLDVAYAATYSINHLTTPILNDKSPYEVLFTKVLDYLKPFGCACFPYFTATFANK